MFNLLDWQPVINFVHLLHLLIVQSKLIDYTPSPYIIVYACNQYLEFQVETINNLTILKLIIIPSGSFQVCGDLPLVTPSIVLTKIRLT
jgi:hypothetical protein